MGIHINLDVDSRSIDAEAWAAAYDDTLVLLEAWRPRLLGWGTRAIGAVELCVYARSIRVSPQASDGAGWSVVGDRESMQTAESLSLHRNLDRYARRTREAHGEDDVVIAVAAAEGTGAGGPVRVFGGKTQGCPYHLALLAAAMLIEERFPQRALVRGDIDRGQAEQARKMAARVLGRDLEIPVCVDAPRLIDRLRARYKGDALVSAFDRLFLNDPMERIEAMLRCFPGPEGARWWIQQLGAFAKPTTFGGIGLLTHWLNAGRDLRDACYLACIDPEGPRFLPDDLMTALASTWVATPLPVSKSPTLASVLNDVFGTEGPRLAERLFAESARHEQQLVDCAGDLQAAFESAPKLADDSLELLATLQSPEHMTERQRNLVRTVGCGISMVLAGLLQDPEWKIAKELSDAEQAKCLLAKTVRERGPVLTDDAWDEILATNDVHMIGWLAALAVVGGSELRTSQVRRALFENAALRRYAIDTGRDPRAMAEFDELLSATGKTDAGP